MQNVTALSISIITKARVTCYEQSSQEIILYCSSWNGLNALTMYFAWVARFVCYDAEIYFEMYDDEINADICPR